MAKGELVTPSKGSLTARVDGAGAPPPGDGNDVWQGYGLRWTNTGLEITAPTSRQPYGPALIGGAVGLIVMLLLIVNIPDVRRGETMVNPVLWGFSAFIAFATGIVVALPFYLLPEGWLRSRKLETLEIRPDGVTLNRKHFFPRHWIYRLGIELLKDDKSNHPWAVVGIIGTKRMELLAGFDDPTAEVVGGAIEQAKRQLWQEMR